MQKNYLLALLSGFLLAISWPTYGISLFLFAAFVPLMLAEQNIRIQNEKRRKLKVFAIGYITFLTWNTLTTWWLWYSTAFGMFFAILVNSLLMTLVFLLYHFVARRLPEKIHLLFLPAIWIAFEKFHLNWEFSWPWLNLGNAFSESTIFIQWYEYTGVFGGSLWVWIVNIGLFKAISKYNATNNKKALSLSIAKNILIIAIPIIISLIILKTYTEGNEKINVVVIQPNVDPYTEKYNQENIDIAKGLVSQALEKVNNNTDYVIAPETVFAKSTPIDRYHNDPGKLTLQLLTQKFPKLKVITGVDFYRLYLQKEKPTKTANLTERGDWYDIYNTAVQIDKENNDQVYIKSKLVVGVETFPFKNILEPILGNAMLDLGGTVSARSTQEEREVFISSDNKLKAAPIICYESIYGEFVTGYVRKDANFLTIITNDAWWDNTQGHKQHLSYAKLRAIETRRSIARSANTGISAFINEKGEIQSRLSYGKKGTLADTITINNKKTFYVRYGDYIARLSLFLAALIFVSSFVKKRTKLKA